MSGEAGKGSGRGGGGGEQRQAAETGLPGNKCVLVTGKAQVSRFIIFIAGALACLQGRRE